MIAYSSPDPIGKCKTIGDLIDVLNTLDRSIPIECHSDMSVRQCIYRGELKPCCTLDLNVRFEYMYQNRC